MVSGALRIGYPGSRAKSTRGERKNGFNMKLHIFHIIFLIFYVSFFSVTLNGRIWVVSFVWREICVLWLGPQNIVNLIWFFLLFNPYQRFFCVSCFCCKDYITHLRFMIFLVLLWFPFLMSRMYLWINIIYNVKKSLKMLIYLFSNASN